VPGREIALLTPLTGPGTQLVTELASRRRPTGGIEVSATFEALALPDEEGCSWLR